MSVTIFQTDNRTPSDEIVESNQKKEQKPVSGSKKYPKAFFNAAGKSRLVQNEDEFAALDKGEWRDSPAAHESHPAHLAYAAARKAKPNPAQLAADRADLEKREAQLKADREAFEAAKGKK